MVAILRGPEAYMNAFRVRDNARRDKSFLRRAQDAFSVTLGRRLTCQRTNASRVMTTG